MFCPKCAIENSNDEKFCRQCGCNLKVVSDALSGKLTISSQSKDKKKRPGWEGALILISSSLALFVVAIVLAFQPMGAGWWFWLLFAAFPTLALGIGQVINIKQYEEDNNETISDENVSLPKSDTTNALPPKQTDFVSNIPDTKHRTGDLVPPSVVERTTKKLEMNAEGEPMNQPKKDK